MFSSLSPLPRGRTEDSEEETWETYCGESQNYSISKLYTVTLGQKLFINLAYWQWYANFITMKFSDLDFIF